MRSTHRVDIFISRSKLLQQRHVGRDHHLEMNNANPTPTSPTSGDNLPTIESNAGVMQNKEPLAGPNQSSVTMMPTNAQPQQQQQHRQPQHGDHNGNEAQFGLQMHPQQNGPPNMPSTNTVLNNQQQQQQHQVTISNQQNMASGQSSIIGPPQAPTMQQQSYQAPPVQSHYHQHPPIKPLLVDDSKSDTKVDIAPNQQEAKHESPQKTLITKVKLSDELNIFDWFRATDIIHQIAEKAKSSVDSVITTLDPGMREYLYSGGNVNIVVISESRRLVPSIRDSFQDVFGRATVVAARYNNPPSPIIDYPIRTACGFGEAVRVAQEKIKKLRSDTSSIPQNQVVVVVQSALVKIAGDSSSTSKSNDEIQPEWFLTYCMLIEDPVLMVTLKTFSELVPVDSEVIDLAKTSRYPDTFQDRHLGFSASIDELMASKLRLSLEEMAGDERGCLWLPRWAGLYETQIARQLALTLANSYRRKWDECATIETVVS